MTSLKQNILPALSFFPGNKRPYSSPYLVMHGSVRKLTLSGAGSKKEASNPSHCSQDGNRYSCTLP